MNFYLFMALCCVLLTCAGVGIVHVTFHISCRKEEKGRHFGATTNGKDPFRVPVARILAGGCRPTRLTCRLLQPPARTEVIYLAAGESRSSALVTGIKVQDSRHEDGSVDVELKLFGARRLPPDQHLFITNLRESNRTISGDPDSLSWPVTARRSRSAGIPAYVGLGLGLLSVVLGLEGMLAEHELSDISFLLLGLCLLAGSLTGLLSTLRFRVTVTRDLQAEIRKGFSLKQYSLRDLTGRIGTDAARGGKMLRLLAGEKQLGCLLESDPGFGDLIAALRLAAEEKGLERLLSVLREVGEDLYVPLLQSRNQGSAIGQMLYRQDGARAFTAYETMELMHQELSKRNQAGDSCMGVNTNLEELVKATNHFELAQIILVFIQKREGLPGTVAVTKDVWERLQQPAREHE